MDAADIARVLGTHARRGSPRARLHSGLRPTAVPPGEGHRNDLLTDKETANVLGVVDSTVRAYATTTGYLPTGTERQRLLAAARSHDENP
ncbi:hypothetical protein ACIOML_28545 [Streptomyces anulatus]